MENNKCKKLFPGGNTTEGFFSYFDYIVKRDATRFFILKGGPGVGKSSFMKKIGNEMVEKGFSIEEHYCSSSNDSLDALVIKELDIGIVDGTSPHIMDPNNPGSVDEIINLGDYLDEDYLLKYKKESIAMNEETGKCFKRAYKYLNALSPFIEDLKDICQDDMDTYRFYQLHECMLKNIFEHVTKKDCIGFTRHLFGSSITPNGFIDYQETVFDGIDDITYIKGNWGTGWDILLEDIAKKATILGYDVDVYHTPLAPRVIEDLVIPELNIALTTKERFIDQSSCVIDLDGLVHSKTLQKYKKEIEYDKKMIDELLGKCIEYVHEAKLAHDKLESFYIPAMDFNAVNEKRKEIVKRILNYA